MKTLYKALLISLIIWIVNFVVHMPLTLQKIIFHNELFHPIYTDFLAYLQSSITSFGSAEKYLISNPYFDYSFAYPPLIGFLWLALIRLTYFYFVIAHIYLSLELIYNIFYIMYSLFDFIFLLIYFYFLDKIVETKSKIFLFIMPSLLIYVIYSWAMLWLALLILLIYSLSKKYHFLSGLVLGLMIATNPYSAVLMPLLIYSIYYERRDQMRRFIGGVFVPLLSYTSLFLSNKSLTLFLDRYFPASCLNCSFLILTSKISPDYIMPLSYIVTMFFVFLILGLNVKSSYCRGLGDLGAKVLLVITSSILFSISYIPQYGLIVASSLLLVARELRVKIFILLSDALNASIILLWFHDLYLRKILSFLNLGLVFNPWSLNSPVQWMVQVRNIIQIIVFLAIASEILCLYPKKSYKPISAEKV